MVFFLFLSLLPLLFFSFRFVSFLFFSFLFFSFLFFSFLFLSLLFSAYFVLFSFFSLFFPFDLSLTCVCVMRGTTCNKYVVVFSGWQAV